MCGASRLSVQALWYDFVVYHEVNVYRLVAFRSCAMSVIMKVWARGHPFAGGAPPVLQRTCKARGSDTGAANQGEDHTDGCSICFN